MVVGHRASVGIHKGERDGRDCEEERRESQTRAGAEKARAETSLSRRGGGKKDTAAKAPAPRCCLQAERPRTNMQPLSLEKGIVHRKKHRWETRGTSNDQSQTPPCVPVAS